MHNYTHPPFFNFLDRKVGGCFGFFNIVFKYRDCCKHVYKELCQGVGPVPKPASKTFDVFFHGKFDVADLVSWGPNSCD
jgi:hypothetical protein